MTSFSVVYKYVLSKTETQALPPKKKKKSKLISNHSLHPRGHGKEVRTEWGEGVGRDRDLRPDQG